MGFTNAYLLPGEYGYLLIDTGSPRAQGFLFRKISRMGISPSEIQLAIITHAHFDHVGCLDEVKKRCGLHVAAHPHEKDLLEAGRLVIPPGTISLVDAICRFGRRHMAAVEKIYRFNPVKVEMEISEPLDLDDWGFFATVVPTPGHTRGSLSLIAKDGTAFVGDLAVNFPLVRFQGKKFVPPFGDDVGQILRSWKILLELGVKRICPSHGVSFPAFRLEKQLS
jgi:glyoxylase-like metal-dependent hydrolase (beta-lactamase superfamily II)